MIVNNFTANVNYVAVQTKLRKTLNVPGGEPALLPPVLYRWQFTNLGQPYGWSIVVLIAAPL